MRFFSNLLNFTYLVYQPFDLVCSNCVFNADSGADISLGAIRVMDMFLADWQGGV